MTTRILVYAEAYPIKEELGGGFRGVAQDKTTKEVKRGEVRQTLDEARNDAKRFVCEFLGDRLASPGYFRRRGSWACNYWGE